MRKLLYNLNLSITKIAMNILKIRQTFQAPLNNIFEFLSYNQKIKILFNNIRIPIDKILN